MQDKVELPEGPLHEGSEEPEWKARRREHRDETVEIRSGDGIPESVPR